MSTSRRARFSDRLRRASVRARTTAAAVVVVAVVLALGAVAIVLSLSAALTEGVSTAAQNRAEEIAHRIDADGLRAGPDGELLLGDDDPDDSDDDDDPDDNDSDDNDPDDSDPDDSDPGDSDPSDLEEFLGEAENEVVVLIGADGTVLTAVGDSDEAEALVAEVQDSGQDSGQDGGAPVESTQVTLDGEQYALASTSTADADEDGDDQDDTESATGQDRDLDEDDVHVLVARSLEDVTESVVTLAALMALGVPVALVLIGATTWIVVGRALRPVEHIRAEAASIDGARLDRRVPEPRSEDEVGRLARTMNLMLDRLETSARRQRQLVADTSHELRSPLASIRQSAEVASAHPEAMPPQELTSTVLAESVRMQGIVDDLLLLARADERDLRLRSTDVDLDDVIYAETSRLRSHSVEVTSQVQPVRTTGDASALTRVVRNLVDNAERHAHTRLHLELSQTADTALIAIEDDGTGVPEEERERIFERFVRLDASRARDDGGSGLGLAIVHEIISAHGGEVRVDESSLGGARFEVRLPTQH